MTYDLARFIIAQDSGGTYDRALAELRGGRKVSHWMWFVFPQLTGLGRSEMAQRYAISSLDEARAYLSDPTLGPRLVACAEAVMAHPDRSAEQIMGGIDAIKLRSSMTLFAAAAPSETVFAQVVASFFEGPDEATRSRLSSTPPTD